MCLPLYTNRLVLNSIHTSPSYNSVRYLNILHLLSRTITRYKDRRITRRQARKLKRINSLTLKRLRKMEKPQSRRQRIYELMKTTKDVYIPTISNTISQLASEATSRALSDGPQSLAPRDLTGAEIIIYPHFTRVGLINDGEKDVKGYFTQVHGWVYSTHGSLRKKKLVFALAKQFAKSKNGADVTAEIDQQIDAIDQESEYESRLASRPVSMSESETHTAGSLGGISRTGTQGSNVSSLSSHSMASQRSEYDDVLKERIANFVNRSLGNLELSISIGGGNEEIKVKTTCTDENGNFNVDIPTSFKPSTIHVSIVEKEQVFAFQNPIFPGDSKFGIISDIDDTIKRTGVCGDKRQLFRNTFSDAISTWEIPGASETYQHLNLLGLPIFYVSNSPYQLYSNLRSFFDMFGFPIGSMYLKKYSGNLLNSFMEPSHTRKKAPLERIVSHYEDRTFFLIGDTGEYDMEAYVDLVRCYPDRVGGIFLRIAEGSLNRETLTTIKEILSKGEDKKKEVGDDVANLIDLDSDIVEEEHLVKMAMESEKKSDAVVGYSLDLEEGSDSDFFATTESVEPIKHPKRKPPPPTVPKKPEFLKAPTVRSNATSAGTDECSSNTSICTSKGSSATSSARLPPLPQRPIPAPPALPARRAPIINKETFSHYQEGVPFNEEKNDEWISRVLTALIVLRKVNSPVRILLFHEFSEVQDEIERLMKK